MQYRKFGRLDWKASVLGFGAMRLPFLDKNPANINEPLATGMIHYAIDHGVNYIDTAFPYHLRNSEPFIARALRDGYRAKVRVATKMPVWLVQSAADFDRFLDEQMKRLETNHLDFYLLHGLNRERWQQLRDLGVIPWAERAMAEGRFGYLGFSFHDKYKAFKEIVDGYDNWTLCQMQYNYMDTTYQAGTRGLKYAAEKGLAVIIMEPLRGGQLAKSPPPQIQKIWDRSPVKRTPAAWGLLWVWNHPGVTLALSGMSAMEQVQENVSIAEKSRPELFSQPELDLVSRVRTTYRKLAPIPCTGCGYCLPCPSGVEIPHIFEFYNNAFIYDDAGGSRFRYLMPGQIREDQRGDRCQECGDCLKACPQKIAIPDCLKKAHEFLIQKI